MLADTHVHLLAGRDDGPRDLDEAVALCRALVADGVRFATAAAHQNHLFPENTPAELTADAAVLSAALAERDIPLTLFPTGETILTHDYVERWDRGELLSYGGAGTYLLAEMPWSGVLDPRPAAAELAKRGVRLVLAHAERYPEFLHDPALVAEFVAAGCLIQVTTEGLIDADGHDTKAVRGWAKAGLIHLLGSDGHRIDARRPRLADGYRALREWIGSGADKIVSEWNTAVLKGEPVDVPPPEVPKRGWLGRLFGG
jgi:protein-tyrosine phosphatase